MKKYKILSRDALKFIAITAMTLDHIAFVFITPDTPLYIFLRTIGWIIAPVMCFFPAEGFYYTKNRKWYFLRFAIFAVISQPFYFVMFLHRLPENEIEFLTNWNVLFTFCISFLVLEILENKKMPILVKGLLIAVCLLFSEFGDWGYIFPVWVMIFHKCRNLPTARTILFWCSSVFLLLERYGMDVSFQLGILLAPLLIGMYNGKSTPKDGVMKFVNRWGFYVYYPLHMAVLVILNAVIK